MGRALGWREVGIVGWGKGVSRVGGKPTGLPDYSPGAGFEPRGHGFISFSIRFEATIACMEIEVATEECGGESANLLRVQLFLF